MYPLTHQSPAHPPRADAPPFTYPSRLIVHLLALRELPNSSYERLSQSSPFNFIVISRASLAISRTTLAISRILSYHPQTSAFAPAPPFPSPESPSVQQITFGTARLILSSITRDHLYISHVIHKSTFTPLCLPALSKVLRGQTEVFFVALHVPSWTKEVFPPPPRLTHPQLHANLILW